jgi:protocatechuate 3,4-dioxygenase beta subunit
MDNDDRQVGRILTRREVLALLGAAGAALLVGCGPGAASSTQPTSAAGQSAASGATAAPGLNTEAATSVTIAATQAPAAAVAVPVPSCVVRPAQTEGPYFVDDKLNRADIRSDPSDGSVKAGVPLQLRFNVSQVGSTGCTPLTGATVDIWHCDALGIYSDVTDPSFSTVGKKFLRGYQVTDAQGTVQFTTIYPGWYQGRAVHIHFKIRTAATSGKHSEFTSQLYFDDAITDKVHAQAPYASKGQRTLKNAGDGIFRGGGDQLLLTLVEAAQGYTATFDIGLQMT